MKLPPRSLFFGQFYGTCVGAIVNYCNPTWRIHQYLVVVMELLIQTVPDIRAAAENKPLSDPQWTPRNTKIFFTASVIWGAIAPARMFGPDSIYFSLLASFMGGALIPIPFYWLDRKYPKYGFRYIHWPIILTFACQSAEQGANTILTAGIVSFVFQYWMRSRRPKWYTKYNVHSFFL